MSVTQSPTRAISLTPSPTYASRATQFDAGSLVIWTSHHEAGPLTVRRYQVEEVRPDRIGCRAFRLIKADGSDYVTVTGGMPGCNCTAGVKGQTRGNCVHLDALTALIREGQL